LRRVIDPRTRTELRERQVRIQKADAIEVAIDEAVENIAEIKGLHFAGDPCIAHDVDGATVGQEIVEFRPGGELVDSMQVEPEEPAGLFGRHPDVVEIDVFVPEIGSHAHKIALIADY
jgi:hypothetical protein